MSTETARGSGDGGGHPAGDAAAVLHRILEHVVRMTESPHVKVLLLDPEQQVLRIAAAGGRSALMLDTETLPLTGTLSGLVATSGRPLHVDDCGSDPRNAWAARDRATGFVGYLGLPLRFGGDLVGVLAVNTTSRMTVPPQTLLALDAVAEQAAVALRTQQLYRAAEERRREAESSRTS